MYKKDIKNYFQAIRHDDLEKVKALVESDSAYLTATNFAPPKKDDGQSGLQIAFKVGALDIADYLIDAGADVNFMEESSVNEWRTPVLIDCVYRTIGSCYLTQRKHPENAEKVFNQALAILQKMLDKGADPNAKDSYENTVIGEGLSFVQQYTSRHPQFIGHDAFPNNDNPNLAYTKGFTDEEREYQLTQLRQMFKLLIDAGAELDTPALRLGMPDGSYLYKTAHEAVEWWKLKDYHLI